MGWAIGTLGLLFVVLKLIGFITWSWWLVLLPFYAGLAIFLVVLLVIAAGALVVAAVDRRWPHTSPRSWRCC